MHGYKNWKIFLFLILFVKSGQSFGIRNTWSTDGIACEVFVDILKCNVQRNYEKKISLNFRSSVSDEKWTKNEDNWRYNVNKNNEKISSVIGQVTAVHFVCYEQETVEAVVFDTEASKSRQHLQCQDYGPCDFIENINHVLQDASHINFIHIINCALPSLDTLAFHNLRRLRGVIVEHSEAGDSDLKEDEELRIKEDYSNFKLTNKFDDHLHSQSLISTSMVKPIKERKTDSLTSKKVRTIPNYHTNNYLERLHNSDYTLVVRNSTLPHSVESIKFFNLGILSFPATYFCDLKILMELDVSKNIINDVNQLGYDPIIAPFNKTNIVEKKASLEDESSNTTPFFVPETTTNNYECSNSLQKLYLNDNKLTKLLPNCFTNWPNLLILNLQNNYISKVSSDAFHGLQYLENINLAGNSIVSLEKGTFENNKLLKKMNLQNNLLETLDISIFSSLTELQILDLSYNQLRFEQAQSVVFSKMFRLVILDLSHNKFETIWSNMFKGLSSLQKLDLSYNSLQTLDSGCFSNMINLYELDLSNNYLSNLHSSLFYGLLGLSSVNLNNNTIANISSSLFQSLSNLKEIHFRSNNLSSIPKALFNLSFLKSLDLSNNNIALLGNSSFKGVGNLYHLNLSENKLSNLTSQSFKSINSLISIDLSHNKLQFIEEDSFLQLNNLQYLKISSNKIKDMNGLFNGMENLLVLDISDNEVNSFDYAFLPRQLLELNLKNNSIKKIGNFYEIHNFLTLAKLDISYNSVTTIDELSIPNALKVANFGHNLIFDIQTATFNEKKNLRYLDLRLNKLTGLEPLSNKKDKSNNDVQNVKLLIAGNPLICDCQMNWMFSSSRNAKKTDLEKSEKVSSITEIIDADESLCSLPHVHSAEESTAAIRISDTVPDNYLCPYDTHCFTLCHCCDYIACDCQMECPASCSCFHDDTWTINLVDCSHGDLDRLPSGVPMDATVVYLDGNNIKILHAHHFIGRHSIQKLFLNNSNIGALQNRTFHGLRSLQVLHLQDNMILHLNGFEFSGLRHLRELYLQNNRISFINKATFTGLRNLEILHIHNNFIVDFPIWLLKLNRHLKNVAFDNNAWECSCSFVDNIKEWARENHWLDIETKQPICGISNFRKQVNLKSEEMPCIDALLGVTKYEFSQQDLPFLAGGICGMIFVIIVVVILVLYINRRKIFEANKLGISATVTTFSQQDDQHKLFDVYVSYSTNDVPFVRDVLVNKLENTLPKYKVCLHSEDFAEGTLSGDFIRQSIALSRKTIIILSKNYVEQEWKNALFSSNHIAGFNYKDPYIITINYDGTPESTLETNLKNIVKKSHKIKYDDDTFWKQLYGLLPVRTPTPSMMASSPIQGDGFYKIGIPPTSFVVSPISNSPSVKANPMIASDFYTNSDINSYNNSNIMSLDKGCNSQNKVGNFDNSTPQNDGNSSDIYQYPINLICGDIQNPYQYNSPKQGAKYNTRNVKSLNRKKKKNSSKHSSGHNMFEERDQQHYDANYLHNEENQLNFKRSLSGPLVAPKDKQTLERSSDQFDDWVSHSYKVRNLPLENSSSRNQIMYEVEQGVDYPNPNNYSRYEYATNFQNTSPLIHKFNSIRGNGNGSSTGSSIYTTSNGSNTHISSKIEPGHECFV